MTYNSQLQIIPSQFQFDLSQAADHAQTGSTPFRIYIEHYEEVYELLSEIRETPLATICLTEQSGTLQKLLELLVGTNVRLQLLYSSLLGHSMRNDSHN